MALHLIKLCVGVASIEEEEAWIAGSRADSERSGKPFEHAHVTRMFPRRVNELLDGGSLYWVIKGNVQARQRLLDLQPVTGDDGIERCKLVLEPIVVPTYWQPRRAFQGWRYLLRAEAPADLASGKGMVSLPAALRLELAQLGLL